MKVTLSSNSQHVVRSRGCCQTGSLALNLHATKHNNMVDFYRLLCPILAYENNANNLWSMDLRVAHETIILRTFCRWSRSRRYQTVIVQVICV